MLSHDLFEGVFARAGLVTNVELFDEFPSNYLVSATRQQRWARGDWQLLPWILDQARDAKGSRSRSSIPGIARWKMIDNLRRTLSAPLMVATLVAAWTLPSVFGWLVDGVRRGNGRRARGPARADRDCSRAVKGISKRSHLREVGEDVLIAGAHVVLGITFLAHQAWMMFVAIARTIGARVRHTATPPRMDDRGPGEGQRESRPARRSIGRWPAASGIAVADRRARRRGRSRVRSGSPRRSWCCGCSRPSWPDGSACPRRSVAGRRAVGRRRRALRLIARRTWLFFETFVAPEDNGLPPDNFQDDPQPVVDHRTSPTNIGMYLLSTVTARDFGWIGTLDMVERLEETLTTIDELERFHGHLYNWYDTRDLHRLEPRVRLVGRQRQPRRPPADARRMPAAR